MNLDASTGTQELFVTVGELPEAALEEIDVEKGTLLSSLVLLQHILNRSKSEEQAHKVIVKLQTLCRLKSEIVFPINLF